MLKNIHAIKPPHNVLQKYSILLLRIKTLQNIRTKSVHTSIWQNNTLFKLFYSFLDYHFINMLLLKVKSSIYKSDMNRETLPNWQICHHLVVQSACSFSLVWHQWLGCLLASAGWFYLQTPANFPSDVFGINWQRTSIEDLWNAASVIGQHNPFQFVQLFHFAFPSLTSRHFKLSQMTAALWVGNVLPTTVFTPQKALSLCCGDRTVAGETGGENGCKTLSDLVNIPLDSPAHPPPPTHSPCGLLPSTVRATTGPAGSGLSVGGGFHPMQMQCQFWSPSSVS